MENLLSHYRICYYISATNAGVYHKILKHYPSTNRIFTLPIACKYGIAFEFPVLTAKRDMKLLEKQLVKLLKGHPFRSWWETDVPGFLEDVLDEFMREEDN